MYKAITKTIDLGYGKPIILETGKLAKQADGSVVLRQGDTMMLATVVSSRESKPDVDFMPLQVEYQERYSSFGRFPGGFKKREGRSSDAEILTSRLIDRVLRPLFPKDYHAETFVTVQLISAEKEIQPDALAGLAASAAIMVSDIPFECPISEVRVIRVAGEFIVNPMLSEMANADIDIIVGASIDNILMVEGEMHEVSEEDMLQAIEIAHQAIKVHCQAQIEFAEMTGKTQKREYIKEPEDAELERQILEHTATKILEVAKSASSKDERSKNFDLIKEEFTATFSAEELTAEKKFLITKYYEAIKKKIVRTMILKDRVRLDGRQTDMIRPIWSEVDYLPSTHGSAIFTRGETQSLTTVTLGTKLDEQVIDDVLNQSREKFLLHYNFPPFATNDAKSSKGVGRREIGHGNLAHRALKRVIPAEDINPYTIRVVSDILESNGSSSMATVCAGTLALLDAGVKIIKPVSGIAMGLITDSKTGEYAILSDILGDEDHLGDMDFKVCGTRDGITACQMDMKVDGLSAEILRNALMQAKIGRLHILDKMMETISEPRADYKPHVPRMERIVFPKELIGALIGPGGKSIQEIQASTGAVIVIEEDGNTGIAIISGANKSIIEHALRRVSAKVAVPEIGKVYKGKVKSIVAFGAFLEILPGKEGLLHVSEIDNYRIKNVADVLKEGQELEVKLLEIDPKTGKMRLSRKALL